MAYGIVTYDSQYRNVTVHYKGLGHAGKSYRQFSITIGGHTFYSHENPSWNESNEANLIYNVASIPDGWYEVELAARTNQWYPIDDVRTSDGGNQIHIYSDGGGSIITPDEPEIREMTYIKLRGFNSVEEDYVNVEIETNGYGDVYLISISKGWDLYDGSRRQSVRVGEDFISKSQLSSDGHYYGTVSFRLDRTDMSQFPSIPIGTCYLASDISLSGAYYNVKSSEFLCLSKYLDWSVYRGTYETTLQSYHSGYSANVLSLSSVKEDWNRLVNMSFYLEATTYGTIEYAQYANYIPRSGDIITADMYNGLLNAVRRCCNRVGMSTRGLPDYVSPNQIISNHFIYDIGVIIDDCLYFQRNDTNDRVLRNQ